LVIPIGIAPAARSRRTISASAASGCPCVFDPRVVGFAGHGGIALDRDRDPGERPVGRRGLGGRQRLVGHRGPERVQLRIKRLDPPQARLDQLSRMDFPRPDARGESLGPGEDELFICIRHARTIA